LGIEGALDIFFQRMIGVLEFQLDACHFLAAFDYFPV
jgi:hypothetical protein